MVLILFSLSPTKMMVHTKGVPVATIFLVCCGLSMGTLCRKETDKRTYHLSYEEAPIQQILTEETQVDVVEYPDVVKVLSFKRNWFSRYCYNGGNLDPNTGCYSGEGKVDATCPDIDKWETMGLCPVGKECAPGDCVGDDANRICPDKTVSLNKGEPRIRWKTELFTKFARHTCIKSWECLLHKETVRPYVRMNEDKSISLIVDLPNGVSVDMHRDLVSWEVKEAGEFKHCLKVANGRVLRYTLKMKCLGRDEIGTFCIPPKSSKFKSPVMFGSRVRETVYRNFHLTIRGDFKIIRGSRLYVNREGGNQETPYTIQDQMGLQRSSSIEDIISALNSLHTIQYQGIHNSFLLSQRIHDIEAKFVKMLRRLSEKDDRLLAKVLGGSFTTSYMEPEVFEIKRCKDIDSFAIGNCYLNYTYKNGEWVPREKSVCHSTPKEHSTPINVFSNYTLESSLVREDIVTSSQRDDSQWEWYRNYYDREDIPVPSDTTQGFVFDDVKQYISTLFTPFDQIKSWFSFISSFVGWVALFMACRR